MRFLERSEIYGTDINYSTQNAERIKLTINIPTQKPNLCKLHIYLTNTIYTKTTYQPNLQYNLNTARSKYAYTSSLCNMQ